MPFGIGNRHSCMIAENLMEIFLEFFTKGIDSFDPACILLIKTKKKIKLQRKCYIKCVTSVLSSAARQENRLKCEVIEHLYKL